MNLKTLGSRAVGSSRLVLKKHGPAMLTTAGVVGFVGTTVLVYKAAIKAKPKIDDLQHGYKAIRAMEVDDHYTAEIQKEDTVRCIVDGVKDLAPIFLPAIAVGGASILCIVTGHRMIRKEHAALVAAYGALEAGFTAYRAKVREELGVERELDFYHGVAKRTKVPGPEGEVCEIIDYDETMPSPYARFFDETSTSWSKTPDYNLLFLLSVQRQMNDRLHAYGYVFLNEVYDALGLKRCDMGQVVGWLRHPEPGKGDGFIDFGIHDIADECNRAFVNGLEHTVLLDFNVDGLIKI